MVIRILRVLVSLVLVICTPVLLITSNVKWLTLSPANYADGQAKYGAAAAIGVSADQLRSATAAIIEYLQSAPDSLPALVTKYGVSPSFFSQRDMLHLVDVHGLVQVFFQIQFISLVLVAVGVVALIALSDRYRDEKAVSRIMWGSGLTVVALVIIALLSFTNFDAVFLQFHLMTFSNDFWILDPAVDRLIVMFPPNFFYDMMLQAAVQTLVEAIALTAAAATYLRFKRRGRRGNDLGYR